MTARTRIAPQLLRVVRQWPHFAAFQLHVPGLGPAVYALVEPPRGCPDLGGRLVLRHAYDSRLLTIDLVTRRINVQDCGTWSQRGVLRHEDMLRIRMHVCDAAFHSGSLAGRRVFDV
jgi:hypothetical protein